MITNQYNWTDEQLEKVEKAQKIISKLEWLKKNIFFDKEELPQMFEEYILKHITTSHCSYGFKTETLAEMWSGLSLKQIGNKTLTVSLPMIQIYLSKDSNREGYKINFYQEDGVRDGNYIGYHCILGRPDFLVRGICVSSKTKKLKKSENLQFELLEENRDEFFKQFEKYYKKLIFEILQRSVESAKREILDQDWFKIDISIKRFQFLLEEQ